MSLAKALKQYLGKEVSLTLKGVLHQLSGRVMHLTAEHVIMHTRYSEKHYVAISDIVAFWEIVYVNITMEETSPKPVDPYTAQISGVLTKELGKAIGPSADYTAIGKSGVSGTVGPSHDWSTYHNHED